MDKLKISEATQEKLEDAVVSVFMEQYAKALDAELNQKMDECAGEEFPPELDKRCRALIQQEYKKAQNKNRRKSALRVLRSAAVVAMVMLSLSSILFMTVEAFRVPIMNFFVEKTDRYWQMTANPKEDSISAKYNLENPLDGIIADIFELTHLSGSVEAGDLMAVYNDDIQAEITLFTAFSVGSLQVDGENAIVTDSTVAGHAAKLYEKANSIRLVWLDENVSRAFSICAVNVTTETVMYIAETFAGNFD